MPGGWLIGSVQVPDGRRFMSPPFDATIHTCVGGTVAGVLILYPTYVSRTTGAIGTMVIVLPSNVTDFARISGETSSAEASRN